MRDWVPERVAAAAGARAVAVNGAAGGPQRVTIDSRDAGPGVLFVGLPGGHVDGGAYAAQALEAGAWGVLVGGDHVESLRERPGVVLSAADPLRALQELAIAWRQDVDPLVVGITGSTGKTSTKDLLAAMLRQQRETVATAENLNTEIGLPLTILGMPDTTQVLVLEMAMRGAGQIAELAEIADPDVGVIVNVGPVHLELLGSIEAIAAAKAELLDGMHFGATAIVPADEPLLDPHRRGDLIVVTFGPGGDVSELGDLELSHDSAHMRSNALAALAASRALGVEPEGWVDVQMSALRGARIELPGDVVVVDDCYNANPMSMRAALDDLAATAPARRVAVLGDMLELGSEEARFHAEIGAYAAGAGIDLLVTVGARAAGMLDAFDGVGHAVADAAEAAALTAEVVQPGDTVLVKASRGVGLEVVAQTLQAERG